MQTSFSPKNALLALLLVALISAPAFGFSQKKKKKKTKVKPDVVVITAKGNIFIDLFDETPGHRDNFLKLASEGFYDGTTFHRVMKNFMIQGGDPNSKDPAKAHLAGQGGPGYTLPSEFKEGLYHQKGALAAARMPDQVNPKLESSGSQFYIVQGKTIAANELKGAEKKVRAGAKLPDFTYTEAQQKVYEEVGGYPWLDMQYTVYGQVIYGMDVIDKIADVQTGSGNKPKEDVTMEVKVVKRWNDKKKKGKW